jgi:ATPase subunit of ABC transporter with duplicated ATPase domains
MKQILALSHARKSYDGKVVLDDVTLAFLPGAKIGVVGPNGMGKSTLLRMMAGLEQPSNGEVRLMPGYSVGILPQEPVLDETKTVLGNVEEGVAETKALIARYNEIAAQLAAEYSDELLEEMGWLQEQLDHVPPENRIRLVTGRCSVPQAARVYSLIRPLRIGLRRTCCGSMSVTAPRIPSRSSSGTCCAMPW